MSDWPPCFEPQALSSRLTSSTPHTPKCLPRIVLPYPFMHASPSPQLAFAVKAA